MHPRAVMRHIVPILFSKVRAFCCGPRKDFRHAIRDVIDSLKALARIAIIDLGALYQTVRHGTGELFFDTEVDLRYDLWSVRQNAFAERRVLARAFGNLHTAHAVAVGEQFGGVLIDGTAAGV